MKRLFTLLVFIFSTLGGNSDVIGADHSVRRQGVFNQVKVAYSANVEQIPISDKEGAATLVVYSYVADSVSDVSRPVVFAFNGGPIGPSAILHMLAMGPKRLAIPTDLEADPASFEIVANTFSILDVADIVFFDPASTGYSRVATNTKPENWFSVESDARQLTLLIEAWAKKHGRTDSPKFLVGESYGTIRAAVAAQQLAERKDSQKIRGVFLMGQALNIVETVYRPANIVSYVASLPTLAATGWYHGKVASNNRSFEQFLDEVRHFAGTEYLVGLYQGSKLDANEELRLAKRLEELTGLAADIYVSNHLRVSRTQFRNLLLKKEGKVLGSNDTRYTAPIGVKNDPASIFVPAVYRAFTNYLNGDLGWRSELTYLTESPVVPNPLDNWSWGATTPFSNWPYMDSISATFKRIPDFKVAVGVGYHDALTTVGATEHAVLQSGWPQEKVEVSYYEGGHMAYTIDKSLKKFNDDLRKLVTGDKHVRP